MRTIEIRRHSLTKKGLERGHGTHLSQEGVLLARRIGDELGSFDRVLASPEPRARETALAMGYAVTAEPAILSEFPLEVLAVIGHHDRWSWQDPWLRFAHLTQTDPAVRTFSYGLRACWVDALQSLPEDGRMLVLGHGRSLELGVVACLDDEPSPGWGSWGEPLRHCEGVQMHFDGDGFCDPGLLRVFP
jgi:broad specificity phosphatase PhoE